ncbi:MAG: BatA domain-containing protein [Planctomycetota bacterium]
MFLYPTLIAGFAFVAVPLLVHLINLLRHRKTKWAAMDFLLASYRRQRKWIVLRQLLLLLSRLALATVLVALLVGWIGGKPLMNVLGGQTTHHLVVLDDSYSMQQSVGQSASSSEGATAGRNAYDRALSALSGLTRRLASGDGDHQLTVMRASRATLVNNDTVDGGGADVAADLSAQSITGEGRQIERLMSSRASSLRCDLVPALELATDLMDATAADTKMLYIMSDFSRRDWASTGRISPILQRADESGASIRMIDCADGGMPTEMARRNLSITDLAPQPDVWVAGVPVVMDLTIQNHSERPVDNVVVSVNIVTYGDDITSVDPSVTTSGVVKPLTTLNVETIPADGQLTKTFQVFIDQPGTHVIEASLPEDVLGIDNSRACTLPLADAQRVLVIDGDDEGLAAYLVSAVLNPGSQVRLGAIPDVRPVSILRDLTSQTIEPYRAVYLINVPEINATAAEALSRFVADGGGLAWFLGGNVDVNAYNAVLGPNDRSKTSLLPFRLGGTIERPETPTDSSDPSGSASVANDLLFGPRGDLLGPIAQAGNGVFSLVQIDRSWGPAATQTDPESSDSEIPDPEPSRESDLQRDDRPTYQTMLQRSQGTPIATRHQVGRGRVVTVTTGLDGEWNNWPGDPSFVVFMLQTNAMLFSGAAPPTSRWVDDVVQLNVPVDGYLPTATLLPPSSEPPRLAIEVSAKRGFDEISIAPHELLVSDQSGLDELLQPGLVEWQRTAVDGRSSVIPQASVLRLGESDLRRVSRGQLVRDLMPVEVAFLSADDWLDDRPVAGMSSIIMALLIILAVLLAVEQSLAAWASYHPTKSTRSRRSNGSMPEAIVAAVPSSQRSTEPLPTESIRVTEMMS